ncbi:MAG: hypothetical protein R3F50_04630 [Gammaproteobacteria bacterium]
MNLEKLDRIFSISSSLGVLIGIIFLIVEISQNTQAIETEVAWARANMMVDLNTHLSENDDMSDIAAKFGRMPRSEIEQARRTDTADWISYSTYWGARRIYWEARYITQSTPEDRERLRVLIANTLDFPGRRFVLENIDFATLDPEFGKFYQEILDTTD